MALEGSPSLHQSRPSQHFTSQPTAGVQGFGARAVRAVAVAGAGAMPADNRVALTQRIAAALLALTVICMAAARYA